MLGTLYVTCPSTLVFTGQEKTSPSGMLRSPPQTTEPIPLIEKFRSVPGPVI
jgi:hypothetical protein